MPESLQKGYLHFDCASGAAGDMILGALLDVGVPRDVVDTALSKMGIRDQLLVANIIKSGIAATDVQVRAEVDSDGHSNDHHHHYHYSDIKRRIDDAGLSTGVLRRAQDIFHRLAKAEAKLHGTTIDNVAFHEVGATDAIVDIVGCAAAIDWLAPQQVSASAISMGHGTVQCAHGMLPVPSPAALEILGATGATIADGGVAKELCTPTGAAVLAATVTEWDGLPNQVPIAVGYGAGNVDLPDRPNVVRAIVGEPPKDHVGGTFRIEANIDDMNPELCEHVADRLFSVGVVDVWWTAVTMKKSRPALMLSALAPENVVRDAVVVIVQETSSIGVRFDPVARTTLRRTVELVQTEYGPLPVKIAWLNGELVNSAPEYEPCRRAARAHNVALKRVFAAVTAGFEQHRNTHNERGPDGSP